MLLGENSPSESLACLRERYRRNESKRTKPASAPPMVELTAAISVLHVARVRVRVLAPVRGLEEELESAAAAVAEGTVDVAAPVFGGVLPELVLSVLPVDESIFEPVPPVLHGTAVIVLVAVTVVVACEGTVPPLEVPVAWTAWATGIPEFDVTLPEGSVNVAVPEQQVSGLASKAVGQQKRPPPHGSTVSKVVGLTVFLVSFLAQEERNILVLQILVQAELAHVESVQLLRLKRFVEGLKHSPFARHAPLQHVDTASELQGISPYAMSPFGRKQFVARVEALKKRIMTSDRCRPSHRDSTMSRRPLSYVKGRVRGRGCPWLTPQYCMIPPRSASVEDYSLEFPVVPCT